MYLPILVKKNWCKGVLAHISERLKLEHPGLRGFSERDLKNMRTFYETWNMFECNSAVRLPKLKKFPTFKERKKNNIKL